MEETELRVVPAGKIAVVRTSYTRYRITLHGYFCRCAAGVDPRTDHCLNEADEARFVPPSEIGRFAFPSGHARLLAKVLTDPRLSDCLAVG